MSDYLLGLGSERDPDAIKVATRTGKYIPNSRRQAASPARMKAEIEIWRGKFDSLILRSVDGTYNCMGMIFASRRTCIDVDSLPMILREDSYLPVNDHNAVVIGDVIVYKRVGRLTHVGIVVESRVDIVKAKRVYRVLSKWGQSGEFIHDVNDVPDYLGNDIEFWTDRKELT